LVIINKESEAQTEEEAKSTAPAIDEVEVDEATGTLKIKSANIAKLTIKYYLIDTEILFSRQPFIKDQANQFTYVKPGVTKVIAPKHG